MKHSASATSITLLSLLFLSGVSPGEPRGRNDGPPRLVVVLVVDQMLPDHLTRFRDLYVGGLNRLLNLGAVYVNAYHEHSQTVTAVGHATIATGCHPSRHGIVGNSWFDRSSATDVYSAGDEDTHILDRPDEVGCSPRRLLCGTLGDWLRRETPQGRIYSISTKDRSAVVMGGHRPDGVFWYDRGRGTFCTSSYYASAYPDWLVRFNEAKPADRYFESGWTKSLTEEAYERLRPDRFPAENDGEKTVFPYSFRDLFETPGGDYYNWLRFTPFADDMLLRLAEVIVGEAMLGVDEAPDLLFIGLSAADAVGHVWGPFSHEAEDYYVKLDRYLGRFLEWLDEVVGETAYTVALCSDHGVLPLPEELQRRGERARRLSRDEVRADFERVCAEAGAALGIGGDLIAQFGHGVVLDYRVADSLGVERAALRRTLAERIRRLDYVSDVFTYDELADGTGGGRPLGDWFMNGFHPRRGPDLHIVFMERVLVSSRKQGTTHGSPHVYDRRVPLVLAGHGIAAGSHLEAVSTTDVAPTLARLLGIEPPPHDGRVLEEALIEAFSR